MMIIVTPNFHFNGQCRQAIAMYEKAFNVKANVILSYADADLRDFKISNDNVKDLVYHAEIFIGNQRIMLSDLLDSTLPKGSTLSLVITFETADEVKTAYKTISDGAFIITPMKSTTYSSCFVSLIDKFGMRWELMTEQTER